MNAKAFVADMKKLFREPILLLFMFVPFLAITAIKFFLFFGMPVLYQLTGFEVEPYLRYLEAFMILLSPGMLGTVAAFMMIDERDGGIYELLSVTPAGFVGYIANRLLMPFGLSIVYTLFTHSVLAVNAVGLFHLLIIAFISGLQSVAIGLILFSIADDKVKGLTLSKALNSLMMTAGADILGIHWVSVLASLFPFYWTAKIIVEPSNLLVIPLGIVVNGLWVLIAVVITAKRR